MAEIKDHGFWTRYIPVEHPEDAPRGAAFCRREKDGQDWYEYVNVEERYMETLHKGRVKQFEATTVKLLIEPKGRDNTSGPIVRNAVVDETRLFPQDCQLIELMDVKREQNEAALIEEFCNRRIDMKTGKIGELWVPQPPPIDKRVMYLLEEILDRLDRIERR